MNNRVAYTTVVVKGSYPIGYEIGLAIENVKGYAPITAYEPTTDKQNLENEVDRLNEQLGLDKYQAFEIVFSSM